MGVRTHTYIQITMYIIKNAPTGCMQNDMDVSERQPMTLTLSNTITLEKIDNVEQCT